MTLSFEIRRIRKAIILFSPKNFLAVFQVDFSIVMHADLLTILITDSRPVMKDSKIEQFYRIVHGWGTIPLI